MLLGKPSIVTHSAVVYVSLTSNPITVSRSMLYRNWEQLRGCPFHFPFFLDLLRATFAAISCAVVVQGVVPSYALSISR